MSTGILTKYSASAGSGKTFSLTSIYLSHLFRDKYSYRRILAVTFTNKATAEMKSRILDQLHLLATGKRTDYLQILIDDSGKTEEEIRKTAGELLFTILHDFSRFSVLTIDAFFQKVIRSFAREAGLHSGFNIEIDHSLVLSEAVEEMIASSSDDDELKEWLNEFVNSRLGEEKSWNPGKEILGFAGELFRESFRIASENERTKLEDKKFLSEYIRKIRSLKEEFESKLQNAGRECERIITLYSLTDDMFFQKSRGIPGYIRALSSGGKPEPNSYVRAIMSDPPKWSSKAMAPELTEAIGQGLEKTLRETIIYYDSNLLNYNSAIQVLSNIYSLGILTDILKKVRQITSSENKFLLADAGELLRDITAGDQVPFIFEKIGNSFDNYMIDEFQDTSRIQWDNFFPLIEESMSRGNDNLVVGDIKQAIYRFRNSDWRILGNMIDYQFPEDRIKNVPLSTNYRSRSNIIKFNNTLFTILPENIDRHFNSDANPLFFSDLYAEAVQNDPGKQPGGYVRIEFVDNDYETFISKSGKSSERTVKDWKEKVLEKLPSALEHFQDMGYHASDIGIIVRNGREGTDVLNTMIIHNNTCPPEKRKKYNFNIVSDYSLTLSNSPAITCLVSVLKVIDNPADEISMAAILRFYLLSIGSSDAASADMDIHMLREGYNTQLPVGYKEFIESGLHLSLFETAESIIDFFRLGSYPWNVAYLNTFQDLVINYSEAGKNDIRSFLEWWETTGSRKSVVLPANQDAARIYTIQKVKGLEFKVVILPFLSWNDDHDTRHREMFWIRPPDIQPFTEMGVLPLKYRRDAPVSVFSDLFLQEKYSAYIDNLNLLYVAMTRARDAIFGFAAEKPDKNMGISKLLKEALSSEQTMPVDKGIRLSEFFNTELRTFEYGEIPLIEKSSVTGSNISTQDYKVCRKSESLRLKLHGESYFISSGREAAVKINYGKLMHRAFEFIDTSDDIPDAVARLVLEGWIPSSESEQMEYRLKALISGPEVSHWFVKGIKILKETDILIPSGSIKRPDRIMINDTKVVIVDFKFGEENSKNAIQVKQYVDLLIRMGYNDIEGYIWYVDKNKIIRV